MKCEAEILVEADEDLVQAFEPEDKQAKRSDYKIEKTKDKIKFSVKANDVVALRATLTSITQLLATHEKMVKIDDS
ncbi:MAG: KEOPS complex subunit Pcc1 [Candidatus Woesearchaeota archaeon]